MVGLNEGNGAYNLDNANIGFHFSFFFLFGLVCLLAC
ncbi:Uncharacterised protein [Chlamydia trachomatis]|nr:Uncharacterised protein [Chlamydia trachomatis]